MKNEQLDNFYLSKEEPQQGCLLALRRIILDQDEQVSETKKYGMPCFCYGPKVLCYLWVDKITQEPYILFINGRVLDHPQLESGNRKRGKIFRVDPNLDLPIVTIQALLQLAIENFR